MSLFRQVWGLLLAALALALAGALAVFVEAAHDAARTQVLRRNVDSVGALALALSQQQGDAARMRALLDAQFDTGLYRELRLTARDGTVLFARQTPAPTPRAPSAFVALLPLVASPAAAPVSDAGRAVGAVQLTSHTASAHDALWATSARAAAALAALGVGLALLARAGLARLRRAAQPTLAQAQSLLDGRFATVPEPPVAELRPVTRAMNALVGRLQQGFQAQAEQVEALRRQAHTDPLTGLANRAHFLRQLAGMLHGEDGAAEGGLVLLRVQELAALNRQLGHGSTDAMIAALAQALQAYTGRVPGCRLGRLNGSDFALALPVRGVARETAQALAQALAVALPAFGHGISVALGAVETRRGLVVPTLLAAADAALARAETQGPFAVAGEDAPPAATLGEAAWREGIARALAEGRGRLVAFPVLDAAGELLHLECPLRLQLEPGGPYEPAARWLPLAQRARLTTAVDEHAVGLALAAIAADARPRSINLSGASLADPAFGARLRSRLLDAPAAARSLWLEVPEGVAADHLDTVRALALSLDGTGCRLGLEHAGERLSRIGRLLESGIDYVKLDASAVQGLAGEHGRARYLQGVVAMLHGVSKSVIAEGVVEPGDAEVLWMLGIDGITGAWASARRPDLLAGLPPG